MDVTWTAKYIAEFLGTAILVILGNGTVTNILLKGKSSYSVNKAIVAVGYGLAVLVPALMFGNLSGSHLNPAFTVGLAAAGLFSWSHVLPYVIAQLLGAIAGQLIIVLTHRNHYLEAEDSVAILDTFSSTAVSSEARGGALLNGSLNEFFGSFILFFGIMTLTHKYFGSQIIEQMTQAGYEQSVAETQAIPYINGALTGSYIVIGLLVMIVMLSFGGVTGIALNPARDLGPRIVYALLPTSMVEKDKRDAQWWYAPVPVVAPIVAAVVAIFLYKFLFA